MKSYSLLDCERWKQTPTFNPQTRRKISPKGKVYKDLQKACDVMLSVSSAQPSITRPFDRRHNIVCAIVPKQPTPQLSPTRKFLGRSKTRVKSRSRSRSRSPSRPRRSRSRSKSPSCSECIDSPKASEKYMAFPIRSSMKRGRSSGTQFYSIPPSRSESLIPIFL